MFAIVPEMFSHRAARIWGQVLQWSGIRGSGRYDDGILHGVRVRQSLHDLRHGGSLLPNGDVNAVQLLLLVARIVEPLLIDDGVNGDGGLARLTIPNDQLSLTSTDRDERVDGLNPGLHRLSDRHAGDDAGRLDSDSGPLSSLESTLSIDGVAQSVDDLKEFVIKEQLVKFCQIKAKNKR